MRTFAPLQVMNLLKCFVLFFIVTSLAWIGANWVIFKDFLIGWPILIGNVVIAGAVGWWWYKREYHADFSYDEQGFELHWGRRDKRGRKWQDFSRVSLVHQGQGRLVVRLHEDGEGCVDIPASDLKLDAPDFRFEVMGLIAGESPDEALGSARKES